MISFIERKVFFLAVNTGMTNNGNITSRFIEFYADRSSSQLYCAIVGNVVIPNRYGTNISTPTLGSVEHLE